MWLPRSAKPALMHFEPVPKRIMHKCLSSVQFVSAILCVWSHIRPRPLHCCTLKELLLSNLGQSQCARFESCTRLHQGVKDMEGISANPSRKEWVLCVCKTFELIFLSFVLIASFFFSIQTFSVVIRTCKLVVAFSMFLMSPSRLHIPFFINVNSRKFSWHCLVALLLSVTCFFLANRYVGLRSSNIERARGKE